METHTRVEICVLRIIEILCRVSFLCLTYVLIFYIGLVLCDHVRKPGLRSEFPSSTVNHTAQFLKGVNITDHQTLFESATDSVLKTSIPTHHYTGNEGADLMSIEYSNDYADYEDYNLSYVAPEVLVDLEPPEMILSHQPGAPQGRRKPVKDGFVRDQAIELLRLHNIYRSNVTPPAADMTFMEWDDRLAKVAQDWANRCEFRHGFPADHTYPGPMGQNLYMGWDPTGVRALLLWYEEYLYYNLDTLACIPMKQCGHYTQMAWGESSLVGCGMKRCQPRKFLVVCHYNPPGNVVGRSPYVVGKPCSQCQSISGGLCTNNLCVTEDQCTRNKNSCNATCPLKCHNCGTLDTDTCKCRCADGWDSLDCSRRCSNSHESCGKNPGWPTITTCSMNHHEVGEVYCRKMCMKCRDIDISNSINTCCNGLVCDEGHVIDLERNICTCRLLCPGPKCHKVDEAMNKSTTYQDSSSIYRSTSAYSSSSVYRSTSDYIGSLYGSTQDYSGSIHKNISDGTRSGISAEDNGSWFPKANICAILLAFTLQMLFLL